MLKRICLFMAAISFSALYAISALAQSCDLAPTCAELGFTQTTSECIGKKTLICPFDKTAVFCGSSNTDPFCSTGEISFQVSVLASSTETIAFETSEGDLWVDWGDGTFDKNSSHIYKKTGTFTIKICGTITSFKITSARINDAKLISLNLASITKMDLSRFGYDLTGTIPNLPPNLIDGTNMFRGCTSLTGSIPALPDSLTNGESMFYHCDGLTAITSFGNNLINGRDMFNGCSALTGSIPPLPDSLTNGFYMFAYCNNLTGSIPSLPNKLEDAAYMFRECSKLKGKAPQKPTNVWNYSGIFYKTSITNDGSWPSSAWSL